jgi:hypothetical protein
MMTPVFLLFPARNLRQAALSIMLGSLLGMVYAHGGCVAH